MKRSDIIKYITDKLFYGKLAESARSNTRPKFIADLAEQDAESILKELELFGMLPPETKSTPEDWTHINMTQEFLDKHEFKVNRWEPEDE